MKKEIRKFDLTYGKTRTVTTSPRTLREFFDKCEEQFEDNLERLMEAHARKLQCRNLSED